MDDRGIRDAISYQSATHGYALRTVASRFMEHLCGAGRGYAIVSGPKNRHDCDKDSPGELFAQRSDLYRAPALLAAIHQHVDAHICADGRLTRDPNSHIAAADGYGIADADGDANHGSDVDRVAHPSTYKGAADVDRSADAVADTRALKDSQQVKSRRRHHIGSSCSPGGIDVCSLSETWCQRGPRVVRRA